MKTLLLLLVSASVFAQVTINPSSVGVGKNTLPSIPLHINSDSNYSKIESTSSSLIISQHADAASTQNSIQYSSGAVHSVLFNSFSGIYTFYTLDQEQGRIDDVNNRFTLQKEAQFNVLKIETAPMRFNNYAGTNGEILYSLGNGTPAWGSVTPKEPIGFGAILNTTIQVNSGVETDFTNYVQEFDNPANLDFFPTTGVYVAPSNGLYHFDLIVPYIGFNNTVDNGKTTLYIKKNDSIVDTMLRSFSGYGSIQQNISSNQLSTSLKLMAGDIIKFGVIQSNNLNSAITMGADSATWQKISVNGFKVY